MRTSLSRNFLLSVSATAVIFTLVAVLSGFLMFQHELELRQIDFMARYVQERTSNLDRQFGDIRTLQRTAQDMLAEREASLTAPAAHRLVEERLPLQADGTRRSLPEDFDGRFTSDGRRVYGLGAFIADGRHIDDGDARALAAAYPIVSAVGSAAHGAYDNFYFFTPRNRLIIFAPNRPDHLLFYRHDAPATLNFSGEEMVRFTEPAADPQRLTRCTSLQRLIQDHAAAKVGTACVTPAYVRGAYVGAFASTINMTAFFADAVRSSLPGATSLIMRGDGALLASPGSVSGRRTTEAEIAEDGRKLGLPALAVMAKKSGRSNGVLFSSDRKLLVAFGRLSGPDWYFMQTYPAAAVWSSAARSASVILVLGVAASVLITLLIQRMARRAIIRPLQALARSSEVRSAADELQNRRDEIGVLARALKAERDRGDELLASLERRVGERTAELERANAEKSRFLANMSHELRTPLNGVIAVSETLAREQTTPRTVELAQLIVASGRLLERVLTDILDFSKIEAGEMRLENQPFDLGLVVSRVAELHRASAQAKGVQLRWRISEAAEGCYRGDSVRVTQVLSNLLSNAVKFTSEGEVALVVERAGEQLELSVRDTGLGFDAATGARLFQRFEQADVSIRRRFGGTGLGLAICRSLATLMGGDIEAMSEPGVGSCFTMRLPLERVETAPAERAPAETRTAELPGLRVLLAEDHPTNQRVVRLILDAVGVDLTVVENGLEALHAFAHDRYDAILMDMQMPEMDGLTATAELRAMERERGLVRTPVIMLTANALDEHVQASLQAGADLHLSKPLRPDELLDAIAAVVAGGGPCEEDAPVLETERAA